MVLCYVNVSYKGTTYVMMKTILTEWKRFINENKEFIDNEYGQLEYHLDNDCLYLDGIRVDDKNQGKGYGTKLFNQLIDKARELGVNKICAEQHDLDGRVYHMFNRAAINNNGQLNSYLYSRDAEDEIADFSYDEVIDHPIFGKVFKIDENFALAGSAEQGILELFKQSENVETAIYAKCWQHFTRKSKS